MAKFTKQKLLKINLSITEESLIHAFCDYIQMTLDTMQVLGTASRPVLYANLTSNFRTSDIKHVFSVTKIHKI